MFTLIQGIRVGLQDVIIGEGCIYFKLKQVFLKNWDYYQDVFTDEVLSKQPSYPGKLRLSSGLFTDEVLSVHENMISKQKALS